MTFPLAALGQGLCGQEDKIGQLWASGMAAWSPITGLCGPAVLHGQAVSAGGATWKILDFIKFYVILLNH